MSIVSGPRIKQFIDILYNNDSYSCKIIHIEKGCIAIEIGNDVFARLKMTTGSNIMYNLNSEGKYYSFVSKIIGIRINDSSTISLLSPPRSVDEGERRKYYRAPITTGAEYFLLPYGRDYLDLNEVSLKYYHSLKSTLTIDISEGGMKIETKEEMPVGRYALLSISVPSKIILLGKVIRSAGSGRGAYETAFEYVNLPEHISKKISDYIMEKSIPARG